MGRNILRGQQRESLSKVGSVAALAATLFAVSAASAEESGLGSEGARGARWQQSTVVLNVEASVDLLGPSAFDAVVLASTTWENSPGELPTVVVLRGPDDPIGYRRSGANRNTVRYSRDGDPLANGALAITVITFDAAAKQILDADIVLNGEHRFGFFGEDRKISGVVYDLQNVLTHEMGHFFGLGEEFIDEQATMYAYSQAGEVEKRDLAPVDLQEISRLYDEAYVPQDGAGCAGATLAGYSGESWSWGIAWLAMLGLVMRRRSTRQVAGGLLTLSLVVGLASPGPEGLDSEAAQRKRTRLADGELVLDSNSSWESGMIVTRLSLLDRSSGRARQVSVLGGSVGSVRQVVGRLLPPAVGTVVTASQRDLVVVEGGQL